MVHPELVHHPQQNHPLQLPHGGLARLHPALHGLVNHLLPLGVIAPGGLQHLLRQLIGGDGARLLQKAGDLLRGKHGAQQMAGGGLQVLAADVGLLPGVAGRQRAHGAVQHIFHRGVDVLPVQHLAALLVDDLPLGVHHVIVLQHGFPGLEVPGLHLLLGVLNGAGQHLLVQRHVVVHPQPLHQALDALGAEQPEDIVLQGQEEPALPRVALPPGAAPELVVDAPGLVALGAQDVEPPGLADLFRLLPDLLLVLGLGVGEELPGVQDLLVFGLGVAGGLGQQLVAHALAAQLGLGHELGVAAQHDIGAAPGHVGGHGDRPQPARLGHDLRLLLVVLGVQHVVLDARPGEHFAHHFRDLDGHRAHQHRLALLVAGPDLLHHRVILALLGLVHQVGLVDPGQGAVGGDLHNVQIVDGAELLLLGHGGARHARQLFVQAEVVLEGDGGQRLGLPGHGDVLLGLDGLVQALVIPPAVHQAAGELVHDDDLAVLHHVVDVPAHHPPGLDGLVDVVGEGGVLRVGQVFHIERLLRLLHALGGEGGGAGLLVHDIIRLVGGVLLRLGVHRGHPAALQPGHEAVRQLVELGRLLPLAGDDEGGAGLVDEDGVHLVHNGEHMAPLHQLIGVDGHVVPQVVEAELVVGAVGHVGGIGPPLLLLAHPMDDQPHGQTQELVHLAHPLALVLGQVIVHGDDVHALPRQGVEVGGQGGHQGFPLAGLHLGDAALVEDDAADELHPVGPLAQHPHGRLPHGGEGLRENAVQRLAAGKAGFELVRLGPELAVAEGAVLLLQRLDLVHRGGERLDLPLGAGAEYFCKQTHSLCVLSLPFIYSKSPVVTFTFGLAGPLPFPSKLPRRAVPAFLAHFNSKQYITTP